MHVMAAEDIAYWIGMFLLEVSKIDSMKEPPEAMYAHVDSNLATLPLHAPLKGTHGHIPQMHISHTVAFNVLAGMSDSW